MPRLLCRAALLAAAVLVAGCGGGRRVCEVKGKVMYDGKPLPGGQIQFTDEADTHMRFGYLNIDGEFRVTDAPAGPVRVVVRTETAKNTLDEKTAKMIQRKGGPAVADDPKVKGNKYVPIPAKYADRGQTDLRFELRPDTLNEVTVELKK